MTDDQDDPDRILRKLDEAQQSRDWWKRTTYELLADLEKAGRAITSVQQMCRTATIPPVAEPEARLARRILATIEQPAGADAAARTLRQRTDQAERTRDEALAALTRHAAEAHSRKWRHEGDNQAAFDALHRLGNEILADRDRLRAALNRRRRT